MPATSSEIAVVGAGVVGLSVTHALRERGVDVTCFDHGEPRPGPVGRLVARLPPSRRHAGARGARRRVALGLAGLVGARRRAVAAPGRLGPPRRRPRRGPGAAAGRRHPGDRARPGRGGRPDAGHRPARAPAAARSARRRDAHGRDDRRARAVDRAVAAPGPGARGRGRRRRGAAAHRPGRAPLRALPDLRGHRHGPARRAPPAYRSRSAAACTGDSRSAGAAGSARRCRPGATAAATTARRRTGSHRTRRPTPSGIAALDAYPEGPPEERGCRRPAPTSASRSRGSSPT